MPYRDPRAASARVKKWRKEHPQEYKQQAAKLRQKSKSNGKATQRQLKYRYGITLEQYNDMLTSQGGMCAICVLAGTVKVEKKALCVDHDHKTEKVRGLLCPAHNFLIGYAHDSLEELSAAYYYLKHHKEV